jgi:hypothetical protein
MTKAELINFLETWENMSLLFNDMEQARLHFPLLMEITLTGKEKVSWRAAWAADKINTLIPGIAAPWIEGMIAALPQLQDHSKKRQYLKFISLYPIPDNAEGFLFEYCLDKLTSDAEDVSVRVWSMQILYNISDLQPELKAELLQILEQEMEYRPSPGIMARGRKLTALLRKEILKRNRV